MTCPPVNYAGGKFQTGRPRIGKFGGCAEVRCDPNSENTDTRNVGWSTRPFGMTLPTHFVIVGSTTIASVVFAVVFTLLQIFAVKEDSASLDVACLVAISFLGALAIGTISFVWLLMILIVILLSRLRT